ncbi:amiloride-sensitive sodium channel subunit alpha [Ixodes scapularis]|uniref:amiloride-sensitive sodium channel subunit alpha n=1 Tax=Ixodes scapularis TaxID=6945 RepID=UPI001C388960|nr:amiloride-sensitive sodium channel subunit alpha [Ixodes scapularis]
MLCSLELMHSLSVAGCLCLPPLPSWQLSVKWLGTEIQNKTVEVARNLLCYVWRSTSKNLEPPYKNPCQNDWPEELKKYVVPGVVYTKRACDEYCYQVHIFETCGCRSYNHIRVLEPRVMESPVCPDMLKGDCERAVEAQILQKLITCKCLTACEIHYYDTSPSSLAWASHLVKPEYILQEESPDRKKIHARIQIYMKTTKVLLRRKEPKSTVASLFRSIGGLMGVYLGYSSLHIFHVLDVLVDGAWSSLSRILARRRRDREARQEFHTKSLGDEYVLTRFQ